MPSATSTSLDIVVIGAGLGGLAAAISCALGGHNVTVLEQARGLAEVRVSRDFKTHPPASELVADRQFRSELACRLHQSKSSRSGLTRSQ
jgi:2-polyprenyl-6-methoxyphenol hydroxylase-like FAD-dependent oxidoreductase